jgi:LmbE family N-acetylglucosaminyl deacetylase
MAYETVILSPHTDDAVFSLGAALAAGYFGSCLIINIYSRSRYTVWGCGNPDEITQQRRKEDEAAMKHLSVDVDYCGLPDSSLRKAYPSEESYLNPGISTDADETWESARELLRRVIEQNPVAFFLSPLGLGHHIDHRIVRDICLMSPQLQKIAFFEDGTYFRPGLLPFHHAKLLGLKTAWSYRSVGYAKKAAAVEFYCSQVDDSIRQSLQNAHHEYNGERVWTRENIDLSRHPGGQSIELLECLD